MKIRFYLKLDVTEYNALAAMACQEIREAPEQLRYLLITEAKRRGLLPTVEAEEKPGKEGVVCQA